MTTINLITNSHTGEVYCSLSCALQGTLEGALGVMTDERFEEWTQNTSVFASDLENLAILNAGITDEDACGEVVVREHELDPLGVNLCDKCFSDLTPES